MPPIRLRNHLLSDMTAVSNEFIDRYMVDANGEYVKIYLYILRLTQNSDQAWTLCTIADKLECTTLDVNRALNYWTRRGLLACDYDDEGRLIGVTFLDPEAAVDKETPENDTPMSASRVRTLKSSAEVKQILFVAEQYLGRPLTSTDVEALLYFYDELNFSADLLDYLIEYCVGRGSTSLAYIKKVGFSWHKEGITTVDQAKAATSTHDAQFYEIMRGYGLTGRNISTSERTTFRRWINDYNLPMDVILMAVDRTMQNIHSPRFEYTERILGEWIAAGVRSVADIPPLDDAHAKKRAGGKQAKKGTKFNNFTPRNYDYDAFAQQLIGTSYDN